MKYTKYKTNQSGHIIWHSWKNWERKLNNNKIVPERNKDNFVMTLNGKQQIEDAIEENEIDALTPKHITKAKELAKQTTGRKVRKDAVALCSNILTLPPNVPKEDEEKFWDLSFKWLCKRMQKNGLDLEQSKVTAFVHNNETTPHMHFQFIPVQKTQKGYVFNAQKIVNRSLLCTYHKDLEDYLETEMGYRPSLLLDENQRLYKALSNANVTQEQYAALVQHSTDAIRDNIKEVVNENKKLLANEKGLIDINEAFSKLKNKNAEIEKRIEDAKKKIESLKEKNKVLQEKFDKKEDELEDKSVEWYSIKDEIESEEEGLANTKKYIKEDNDKLTKIKQEKQKTQSELDTIKNELKNINEDIAQLESDKMNIIYENDSAIGECRTITKEINEINDAYILRDAKTNQHYNYLDLLNKELDGVYALEEKLKSEIAKRKDMIQRTEALDSKYESLQDKLNSTNPAPGNCNFPITDEPEPEQEDDYDFDF